MLTYIPCHKEHIYQIDMPPGLEYEKESFIKATYSKIVDTDFSLSAWEGHVCVGAAGLMQIYPHRAVAWTMLGWRTGPYMREITRKVKFILDTYPAQRIEMLVNYEYEAGHRWAKMLGFAVEAPRMRGSGVLGQDETLYVRIKENVGS